MEKNAVTNLKHGALQLTQEMKDMIVSMENDDICATLFHLWRLKSTCSRIRKHERRGFIFDQQTWDRRLESLIEREEEREEEKEHERLVASGAQGWFGVMMAGSRWKCPMITCCSFKVPVGTF